VVVVVVHVLTAALVHQEDLEEVEVVVETKTELPQV
jgi:hypothetical protein